MGGSHGKEHGQGHAHGDHGKGKGAAKGSHATVSEQRRDILKSTTMSPFLDRFEQKDYNLISDIIGRTFEDTEHLSQDDFKKLCSLLVAEGFFQDMQVVPYDEQLFQYFDLNHDGELSKRELMGGLALIMRGTAEEKLRLTFDLFDADGNGKLDRGELFRCVKAAYLQAINLMISEEHFESEAETKQFRKRAIAHCRNQVDEIFAECDSNADYVMDFNEFKKWGLSSPIVRLEDLKGHSFDVRLTLHVKDKIHDLPEVLFVDVVAAKIDVSAVHAKVIGYCCVVSLVKSNLQIAPIKGGGVTEVIHSNTPEWNHTFKIDTTTFTPHEVLAIRVEIHNKNLETGLEKSVGMISLDWGYLEKKYGSLVDYSLIPDDETQLRKNKHCHGTVKVRVRSSAHPEASPSLKNSFIEVNE